MATTISAEPGQFAGQSVREKLFEQLVDHITLAFEWPKLDIADGGPWDTDTDFKIATLENEIEKLKASNPGRGIAIALFEMCVPSYASPDDVMRAAITRYKEVKAEADAAHAAHMQTIAEAATVAPPAPVEQPAVPAPAVAPPPPVPAPAPVVEVPASVPAVQPVAPPLVPAVEPVPVPAPVVAGLPAPAAAPVPAPVAMATPAADPAIPAGVDPEIAAAIITSLQQGFDVDTLASMFELPRETVESMAPKG